MTVYDRVEYLERTLRSVLAEAPDSSEMEIVVVADGGRPDLETELRAVTTRLAGDRVRFAAHDRPQGQPGIFTRCVELCRGDWIHILHDDDYVLPGFYRALGTGLAASDCGAAFCRYERVDQEGRVGWRSWLERETPGIIEGWRERLARQCRVHFSSVAVKRSVYESLGGFCGQIGSAFDWEMWKRIAAHHPFWFEPQPLACFRQGHGCLSDELLASGAQVRDNRACILFSAQCFPNAYGPEVTARALEEQGLYALSVAEDLRSSGRHEAAYANFREGFLCSRSDRVLRAYARLFTGEAS